MKQKKKSYLSEPKCDAISYDGNAAIMMLMCICRREYIANSAKRDRQGEKKRGNHDNAKTEGERTRSNTENKGKDRDHHISTHP